MNELSLFSGAGGGVLGSKLLGWRTVGYVEYEKYCQEILKQRISDGVLDAAPIFGDIRSFIREGYAKAYQGMVDVVSGGFPCQPFSVAGKGLGEADPRNMWPATLACVRIIRPPLVFLENVPGLLADPYMGRIFGDLAESGYRVRWTCLGADDVGANHRRKRLWILAYTKSMRSFSVLSENNGTSREGIEPSVRSTYRRSFGMGQESSSVCLEEWKDPPEPDGMAHVVASQLDRLKAIGNGQVPLCMARAFQILSKGIE